jgi:hypothetical protein
LKLALVPMKHSDPIELVKQALVGRFLDESGLRAG